MDMYDEELEKYVKKKESSVSKAKEKSKHKHEYKSCLLKYMTKTAKGEQIPFYMIASYCIKCGKIGANIDKKRKSVEILENGCMRQLTPQEILERNSDLEVFEIEGLYDKYVPLTKEC